ncbi:DNA gyrase inhibitor YacG [Maritimibacter sp. DP1N21-5]|uniref:DNA gyrase inhibitor YacG n=1 Tax=Maritimibacter sp. DP1N21-5 TaxID=2836867 RepID=UPI001C486432|nr:DNA gyrase inhibitor YacG [Maritimibacter sp. DP1N21-5]MBV7410742.1 DNA gyrase inhibitor YacG [Maritimibacter sp. DP1N21-5]
MACPICSKPTNPEYRPFCSKRCADVDLGKWLNGSYRVPGEAPEDIDQAIDELEAELERRARDLH